MPWVKCYKDARSTKEKEEEGQVRRSLVGGGEGDRRGGDWKGRGKERKWGGGTGEDGWAGPSAL